MDERAGLQPLKCRRSLGDARVVGIAPTDAPARMRETGAQMLATGGMQEREIHQVESVRIGPLVLTNVLASSLGEASQCAINVHEATIAAIAHRLPATVACVNLIDQILGPRPSVSFEFFPPKDDDAEAQLWATLADLEPLEPTFVSVTYGAGGTSQERTVRVTERIARESSMLPVGHLTLVNQSKAELEDVLYRYREAGVNTILALRGDPQGGPRAPWESHPGGLDHAVELVELASGLGDFTVGVAAFPEAHPDAANRDVDADVLVAKDKAGAEFAITQLFFRASDYFELVERVAARGSALPVIPGIMPILNYGQVARMAELSGAELPTEVLDVITPLVGDAAAVRAAGIELATQLCRDLLTGGAPGLHFITLNRSKATREIHAALAAEGLL